MGLCIGCNESMIECCIVRDKNIVLEKCKKSWEHFLYSRGICYHSVGYSRKITDKRRDRLLGVDECLISIENCISIKTNRCNFYDTMLHSTQASRFDIYDDVVFIVHAFCYEKKIVYLFVFFNQQSFCQKCDLQYVL